jgi:hypothetical protein
VVPAAIRALTQQSHNQQLAAHTHTQGGHHPHGRTHHISHIPNASHSCTACMDTLPAWSPNRGRGWHSLAMAAPLIKPYVSTLCMYRLYHTTKGSIPRQSCATMQFSVHLPTMQGVALGQVTDYCQQASHEHWSWIRSNQPTHEQQTSAQASSSTRMRSANANRSKMQECMDACRLPTRESNRWRTQNPGGARAHACLALGHTSSA